MNSGNEGVSDVPSWHTFYKKMKESAPFVIYYPICGGGDECITACPYGDKIWSHAMMRVSLFGVNEKPRLRPIMAHPELCRGCQLCVAACPTGALMPAEKAQGRPWLRLIVNILRLPFKKRYGLRYVLRSDHVEKFRRNNFIGSSRSGAERKEEGCG